MDAHEIRGAAIFPLDKSDVFQYYKNMPKKAGSTDNVTYRKPKRTFENSGIVNPEASYYVLLENVVNTNKQDIKTMVDKGRYFSIFAPRQSGKTTFLEEFCSQLHQDPTYIAMILCFQDFKNLDITGFYSEIEQDIYDQLITRLAVTGVSPYNIADQVKFPSFSLKNVRDLYRQYTEETNQPFTEEAVKKVFEETAGQPWLVNRLGTILTVNIKPETVEPIDEKDVEQAVQLLLKEKNNHFHDLYEKVKPYKETFVEIAFNTVKYYPEDEEQTWLEEYGLIRDRDHHAVVANNVYKARFLKTFFKEVKAYEDISPQAYALPGDRLDMKRILLNFGRYISYIGVKAFYAEEKTYEKTGQFLLTAWLYQFIEKGNGELRHELRSWLGVLDILLTYKDKKYIIETKVNRYDDITRILEEGVTQVTQKYFATEAAGEGYLVIFDTKTHMGAVCEPKENREDGKKVIIFIIGIGKNS